MRPYALPSRLNAALGIQFRLETVSSRACEYVMYQQNVFSTYKATRPLLAGLGLLSTPSKESKRKSDARIEETLKRTPTSQRFGHVVPAMCLKIVETVIPLQAFKYVVTSVITDWLVYDKCVIRASAC
jgi:hypothetical protein